MSASAKTVALLRALSIRRVALSAGAIVAAIWVGGFFSGSGWTLSFDADLGLPNVISGILAIVAGWLLWVAGGSSSMPRSERRPWRSLAVALGLIGFEQMFSLHERVADGLSASAAVGALPLLILAAVALAIALRLSAVPERAVLLGGLGVWAVAGILDAFGRGDSGIAALLVLVATPVLAVAALAAVQRFRFDPASRPPPADLALRDLLLEVDVTRLVVGFLLAFAALIGVAAIYHSGTIPVETFDLRSQQGANTFSSIALLATAGGLALLRGRFSSDPWHTWDLLGVSFFALAVNDTIAGHHLVGQETGIPGQFGLFPVVVAAGIGWLGCMRLCGGRARLFLAGGAVAWFLAQAMDVVEAVVSDRPEGTFQWWVLPEEALELFGSTLFVAALILAVQATVGVRGRDTDSGVAGGRGASPVAASSGGV